MWESTTVNPQKRSDNVPSCELLRRRVLTLDGVSLNNERARVMPIAMKMTDQEKRDAANADYWDFLTVREAADLCRVHADTIRSAIKSGRLRVLRLSKRCFRVSRGDLIKAFSN
jgi:excisionase family DNA binding protein